MGTKISFYEYRDKMTGTDETRIIYGLGASARSKSLIVGSNGEKPPKKFVPTDQMLVRNK